MALMIIIAQRPADLSWQKADLSSVQAFKRAFKLMPQRLRMFKQKIKID
jgi:hypothetical protein